jgi:3-phenylpropionate/cinnamic acid dioxygenase small subunit
MSTKKTQGVLALLIFGAAFTCVSAAQKPKLTADDILEIQALYHNYAHYFDAGDGEKWASLWTEDGEFTHGFGRGQATADRTPAKGMAALIIAGNTGGTRHFVADLVITPLADGTTKGSCYLLLYTARTNPPSFVETAIYDDTLARTPRGWKFKKRVVWRDDDDISPFKPKPLPQGRAGG